MLPGGEPHQAHAQQRPAGQVERPPRFRSAQALQLPPALRLRQRAEVDQRQGGPDVRIDRLDRPALDGVEARAQRLVAADDLLDRGGERRHGQRSAQAQRHRDVVDGALRLELLQEPEPLLGEGERDRAEARRGHQRRRRHARGPQPGGQAGRETGHSRSLEQLAHRHLDTQGRAHPRGHPGGEQRVPAELEEALLDPDPLDPEDLGEDAGQQLLDRVARRLVPGRRGRGAASASRARRSTLPFGVSGSASRKTNADGTMYSGRRSARDERSPRAVAVSAAAT